METQVLIKEKKQQVGGYKVVQKGKVIEAVNNLNQVFHFIDLSYTQADIMYHGWSGFRSNEQFKETLDGHFIEVYKVYRCKNMLLDASKMSGSFSDTNEWNANYFMPKLQDLGLKNVSVVLPQDIFAQIAIKDWLKKTKCANSSAHYTLSEALNWLAIL
jgi:hypothetical protein